MLFFVLSRLISAFKKYSILASHIHLDGFWLALSCRAPVSLVRVRRRSLHNNIFSELTDFFKQYLKPSSAVLYEEVRGLHTLLLYLYNSCFLWGTYFMHTIKLYQLFVSNTNNLHSGIRFQVFLFKNDYYIFIVYKWSKVEDRSQRRLEGSLFNSYCTEV